jgi:hypothetical protein
LSEKLRVKGIVEGMAGGTVDKGIKGTLEGEVEWKPRE